MNAHDTLMEAQRILADYISSHDEDRFEEINTDARRCFDAVQTALENVGRTYESVRDIALSYS